MTIQRKTPLKRSTKRMRKLRPHKKLVRADFRRATMKKNNGMCVRHEYTFGIIILATDPHHWRPLGRRGNNDKSNGLPVCPECHRWIHDNPLEAEAQGYLITYAARNEHAEAIAEWLRKKE